MEELGNELEFLINLYIERIRYLRRLSEDVRRKINNTAEKLSKARFQFALKCLHTVVQIKTSENVVFSPYSIYDGLLLTYLASDSDHDTEEHLKRILQLPANVHKNVTKEFWKISPIDGTNKKNREKSNGYYNVNSCWIKSSLKLRGSLFDRYEVINYIPNLMHRINEELRNEIKGYIRQPVELNGLDENIKCIISSVLRFKGDIFLPNFLIHVPNWMDKPRTVLYPKLGMFVTELPHLIKIQSMFLLFPAVQSLLGNNWEVDEHISGLVERLTTKEGTDELRKVLDKQKSSTEKLLTESVIYPDFFELQYELPMDQLLTYLDRESLKPDEAINLSPGISMHRAYIKITTMNVFASAVNMFFTKNRASFNSSEGIDNSKCKNSFVWIIYDRTSRTILFIGVMNKNHQLPQVSSAEYTASSSNIVETK